MLVFNSIRYKNFLSTGNVVNSIELNKYNSTLITGKNGEGKSTILCALTFGLFGKPFRNISKQQLVNSINKKNCLVEIDFSVNGQEYTVRRGIKPNIFDILCNGELINQDAALKDYQKVLEQQILKLNYKTFTQVVILGSATFVPFMQLSTSARREVIEDILDIRVFSVMNQILKEKSVTVKDEIARIESAIVNQRTKIASQKKLIDVLESNRQSLLDGIRLKIQTNDQSIEAARHEIERISDSIASLKPKADVTEVNVAVKQATKMKVKLTTTIESYQHNVEFFHDHTTCPTCTQQISEDHRNSALSDINAKIAKHQETLDQINSTIQKLEAKLERATSVAEQIQDLTIEMSTHSSTITLLVEQNLNLQSDLQHTSEAAVNLVDEKSKMRQLAEDAIELVTQKTDLMESRQLHEVASALLKDTGIKTAIIREYLPVMNKLINKYLAAMDFFVSFELDESFQEAIRSRGRDVFTYSSFSEGEKRRLDLAILFTWRQIAKMKNSVNTNILILDEILDGALDAGGIDYFLSIMNAFGDNTNVFVISHRDVADKFDNVIRVEKRNDFSIIT